MTTDLAFLACQVCFERRPPPWSGCSLGHRLCVPCFGKLAKKECPTCSVSLERGLSRQLLAEEMARAFKLEITYPCRHEGCEASLPAEMLAAHESVCPRRRFECPCKILEYPHAKDCPWTGTSDQAFAHMKACIDQKCDFQLDQVGVSWPSLPDAEGRLPDYNCEPLQLLVSTTCSTRGNWVFEFFRISPDPLTVFITFKSEKADMEYSMQRTLLPWYEAQPAILVIARADLARGDGVIRVEVLDQPKRPAADGPTEEEVAKAPRLDLTVL